MAFQKGEHNPNAKLTTEEADLICELWDYRKKRISEINDQIESLENEKRKLKTDVSRRQLAFKFEVSERTITYLLKGAHY